MTRTVLITGFEPFAGAERNVSAEVARALHGTRVAGRRVEGCVLPVVFGESLRRLRAELRRCDPELVIALGLAGNRRVVSLERVAINLDDARIPDNAGHQPVDTPVAGRGPAARWTTLPVKAIAAALRARGLPVEVSHSAGTFVCNHVFYGLMQALARRPGVRGGFIHLPPEATEPGEGLTLADQVAAVRLAVLTTLRGGAEPERSEGTLS